MTYYHGTSTIFNIHRVILPPNITGNLREDWRKANLNQVYVTDSLLSAQNLLINVQINMVVALLYIK